MFDKTRFLKKNLPVTSNFVSVLSLSCCIVYIIREVQLERAATEYRMNKRGEKFYRFVLQVQ